MESMALTSGMIVETTAVHFVIQRIINRTYKLLPMREQGKEWQKLLEVLIEQINGMKRLINDQDNLFVLLLCKMEGLFSLKEESDMSLYRRVIFECLNLLNSLKENVCGNQ